MSHPSGTSPATGAPALGGMGIALVGFSAFSLHDAFVKSITGISVFQIVFFVVLFSFVPFAAFIAFDHNKTSLRPVLPGLVALRCTFTTLGLVCVFYAFGNLPMAEAYALIFSAPILITLLAIAFLGERVKLIRWVAITLGMVGIMVVLQPGQSSLSLGHMAALTAAFCTACTSVVTRKIGSREHSLTLILYPMLVNFIVSGVALLFVYQPMPGDVLARLAGIGVLSVIGQSLMIQAYRRSEAQFVAPMQYSQMLWAVAYGALVFDEAITQPVLVGATVIVLSGLLFIWREVVASVGQPILRTRNLRAAGGPQVNPSEADRRDTGLEQAPDPVP